MSSAAPGPGSGNNPLSPYLGGFPAGMPGIFARTINIHVYGDRIEMKNFVIAAVALLFTGMVAHAQTPTQSHLKAAEDLFAVMHMEKVMSESLDNLLEMQIKQNPSLAQFSDIMKDFLGKYMSWNSLKDDMAKVYADAFTEQELRELATFYKTELGQKTASLTPALMAKGMAMGQQRVQEHMSELQQLIMAKMGAADKSDRKKSK